MDIKVVKANELAGNIRPAMSLIFVEGWYDSLKMLCKNKTKLSRAFEHIFKLENFYVASVDSQIVAFIALSNREHDRRVVQFDKQTLQKNLGLIRGHLMYSALNKAMITKQYPFEIAKNTGVIEFVATLPEARGKGLARQLIEYGIVENEYQNYILEVADTNRSAISLYEKLGFREFEREKSDYPKKYSGFEWYLYMEKFPGK